VDALAAYELQPGSRADAATRLWSVRRINAVSDTDSFAFISHKALRFLIDSPRMGNVADSVAERKGFELAVPLRFDGEATPRLRINGLRSAHFKKPELMTPGNRQHQRFRDELLKIQRRRRMPGRDGLDDRRRQQR
jgi:hypothetical protein